MAKSSWLQCFRLPRLKNLQATRSAARQGADKAAVDGSGTASKKRYVVDVPPELIQTPRLLPLLIMASSNESCGWSGFGLSPPKP